MTISIFFFSGTSNTDYAVHVLKKAFDTSDLDCTLVNISNATVHQVHDASIAQFIIFAYPVYGGMAPMAMWQFVQDYSELWADKTGGVIATYAGFAPDGAAYLARVLKRKNFEVLAIDQFRMPLSISDIGCVPVKNGKQIEKLVAKTTQRLELFALDIVKKRYFKIGNQYIHAIMGTPIRLLFSKAERRMAKNVKIAASKCTLCGICARECPVDNLYIEDESIKQREKCTVCYRCVNNCPEKAISIM